MRLPDLPPSYPPHVGRQLVVVDTPAGRLGLTTCYDLRFPEMYAKLTWEMGAQVRREGKLSTERRVCPCCNGVGGSWRCVQERLRRCGSVVMQHAASSHVV